MKTGFQRIVIGAVILAALSVTAYSTRPRWQGWLDRARAGGPSSASEVDEHAGHDHAGHSHGGDAKPVLTLSDQARQNLGLEMVEIGLSDYWRTIQIPGIVSEKQGHSERRIPATVAGIVTKLHIFAAQSVRPGDALMDIQPTGELLTSAQASLLRTLQDIELIDIELKRITPLVESGSLPAKNKIEKEYGRRRLESQQLVQTQWHRSVVCALRLELLPSWSLLYCNERFTEDDCGWTGCRVEAPVPRPSLRASDFNYSPVCQHLCRELVWPHCFCELFFRPSSFWSSLKPLIDHRDWQRSY